MTSHDPPETYGPHPKVTAKTCELDLDLPIDNPAHLANQLMQSWVAHCAIPFGVNVQAVSIPGRTWARAIMPRW